MTTSNRHTPQGIPDGDTLPDVEQLRNGVNTDDAGYEPYTPREIQDDINTVAPWIAEGIWYYDVRNSKFRKTVSVDRETFTVTLAVAEQVHAADRVVAGDATTTDAEGDTDADTVRYTACGLAGELRGGYLIGVPKGGSIELDETVVANTGEHLYAYNTDQVATGRLDIEPQPITPRYQSLYPDDSGYDLVDDAPLVAIYSTTGPVPQGDQFVDTEAGPQTRSQQSQLAPGVDGGVAVEDSTGATTAPYVADSDGVAPTPTPRTPQSEDVDTLPLDTAIQTITGDSRNVLPRLPDESIQLTVTSPPYDIDQSYGGEYKDRKGVESWKQLMYDVLTEVFRATKPDGKLVINLGKSFAADDDDRFRFYPLVAHIKQIALAVGFDFWDEVVWDKQGYNSRGGGALMGSYPHPTNLMVTQTHEHILVFRKWVSEDYHEQRTLPDPESERKQQSALTKERWREITQSVWEVSPVRQSSLKSDHDAVYPEELPKRAIQMYSFAEDRVLDPFGGIGTTGVAAKKAGRKYIGIEQSEEFASEARERIAQAEWDKPGYITPRNSTDTDSSPPGSESSQRSLDTF